MEVSAHDHDLRYLIHYISTELGSDNVRGLCFLFGVSNAATGRCRCCSQEPLHVMEYLLENGFYTQDNMAPLVEALEELGRNDLASKCKELPPMPPLSAGGEIQLVQYCLAQLSSAQLAS